MFFIYIYVFYIHIYTYIYIYIYVFGEGNGNSLQYSCLENPMDRGAWQATYSSWGHKESDTTEGLTHTDTHIHTHTHTHTHIYIYIILDVVPENDLSVGIRVFSCFLWPPCGMEDLNSLTKNQTCAPCNESMES